MIVLTKNVADWIYYFADMYQPFTVSLEDAAALRQIKGKKKFRITKNEYYATVWRTR